LLARLASLVLQPSDLFFLLRLEFVGAELDLDLLQHAGSDREWMIRLFDSRMSRRPG